MKIEHLHLTELIHELTGCSKSMHGITYTHCTHSIATAMRSTLSAGGLHLPSWIWPTISKWTDVEVTWTKWRFLKTRERVSSQRKPWLST